MKSSNMDNVVLPKNNVVLGKNDNVVLPKK